MQSVWKLRGQLHSFDHRSMVMGILNVTPDSFSDGGCFYGVEAAIEQGLRLVEEGADILDIGGESTRPGSDEVSESEELRRVLPVIEGIRSRSSVLISIDTMKPQVAEIACEAGADIINDVNGFRAPGMAEVAAKTQAGLILMHMKGMPKTMQVNPIYEDLILEVRSFFEKRINSLLNFGVEVETISLDPGIGFGKTLEHNMKLLQNLEKLRLTGRPLVLGLSKKTLFSQILNMSEVDDRHWGTVASSSFLRENGVEVIRVHDVKSNFDAIRMTEAILG